MKKIILGSLFLILLISGCIEGIPGLQNCDIPFICQQNTVNVTKLGPDILVIQNINVIPKSEIRPENEFSVFFEVKNQEDNERVPKVHYYLFDTGLCTLTDWGSTDTNLKPSKDIEWGDFAPSETKLVEWRFKAPNQEDMAGLRTQCPIRFKVIYNYTSRSQIDIGLIDEDRLKDLQRTGKDITYSPNLNIGRGPVKIYFDFGGSLPAREGSNLPFYVRVVDEGTGLYGEIPKDGLVIEIIKGNPEFKSLSCSDDYFSTCDNLICKNDKKTIPLIKKKTFDIKCNLEISSVVEDEVTKYVKAHLNYSYDVMGAVSVEVKP